MCYGYAVAPIKSIPEEILIAIFQRVVSRYGRDESFRIFHRSVRSKVETDDVIVLSHVCTLWRDVVINCPLFWTRMDGNHNDKLQIFIARSQSLPISLLLSSRSNNIHTIMRSHGVRIKRLDLTLVPHTLDPSSLSLADCPMLECVTLTFDYNKRAGEAFYHGDPFLLFGEQVLHFKALAISSLSGAFPANYFPNLTHMCIGLDVRWAEDTINFSSTIFNLLSNTPKLQFLSITGLSGSLDAEPNTSQMPVRLDDLRSLLFIDGELSSCAIVLSALYIPHDALIRLYDLYVVTVDVPQLPRTSVLQAINRLSIHTEGVHLEFVAEGPACAFWMDAVFTEDPFEEAWDSTPSWNNWLLELPGWLPLGQVTQLEISLDAQVDIVLNLLGLFSRLAELRICLPADSGVSFDSYSTAACTQFYTALAQEDPVLCPGLQVLCVEIDGGQQSNPISSAHAVLLANMIKTRHRCGHPILRVVLQPFNRECTGGLGVAPSLVVSFEHLFNFPTLELCAPGVPRPWPHRKEIQGRWVRDEMEKYWVFQ
uniref:Ubiquitin ligase complex F-box protein GRR1, putative n=1 Tax=Ganoderma boninense TaxID=34458 RepID=A0A5K1JWA3_9APHY|nr:Ubiquitin ligase complex F-box protein GRR1, putative [Ganoderma boninense]